MIYESTVQFVSVDNKGNDRVVKQKFLIANAETHGDAETQTYNECDGETDLDVVAVKRSKIKEILNTRQNENDSIFLADVADVVVDDDGEEKELIYKMAFYSSNADSAYAYIRQWLLQGYSLSLVGLKKTKFADVI